MTLMFLAPTTPAALAVSRGSAAANLLSPDPKEVWVDTGVGSGVAVDIDLGSAQPIDTIFLGFIRSPVAGATWSIGGGVDSYASFTIKDAGALRVPDAIGTFATTSHAFWRGAPVTVRYIRITLVQPTGAPLTAGVLMLGSAWSPAGGMEWGYGRQPIDTGSVTPLASGGFAIVEGVRKRACTLTLDLAPVEVDQLEAIALARGETQTILFVEDASPTAGLRSRIHYGLFQRFRPFDRRNKVQTKWEIGVEEWV